MNEQLHNQEKIPQHNELCEAIAEHDLLILNKTIEHFLPLFRQDPELSAIVNKLEEISQGNDFIATTPWKEPSDHPSGKSLLEVQYDQPIGASPNQPIAVARWKEQFPSKKACKMMWHPQNLTKIKIHNKITQDEVGTPRPPNTRTPEQRAHLTQFWMDCLDNNLSEEEPEGFNHPRLLINVFPVYSTVGKPPRFCMDGSMANAALRHDTLTYKDRGGARAMLDTASYKDSMVGWDLAKMFHQFQLQACSSWV